MRRNQNQKSKLQGGVMISALEFEFFRCGDVDQITETQQEIESYMDVVLLGGATQQPMETRDHSKNIEIFGIRYDRNVFLVLVFCLFCKSMGNADHTKNTEIFKQLLPQPVTQGGQLSHIFGLHPLPLGRLSCSQPMSQVPNHTQATHDYGLDCTVIL